MTISWIVFLAISAFYLVVGLGANIESQELAFQLTNSLVSGYLGYLTHKIQTLLDKQD